MKPGGPDAAELDGLAYTPGSLSYSKPSALKKPASDAGTSGKSEDLLALHRPRPCRSADVMMVVNRSFEVAGIGEACDSLHGIARSPSKLATPHLLARPRSSLPSPRPMQPKLPFDDWDSEWVRQKSPVKDPCSEWVRR